MEHVEYTVDAFRRVQEKLQAGAYDGKTFKMWPSCNHATFFTGKVVIVTGASSGIGKACARAFFDAGASVVLAARSSDTLQHLQEAWSTPAATGSLLCVPTDVTKESDCKYLIETTLRHFGRLDILVCNAGLSMRALFKDLDLSVIRQLMEVNFWGCVYCTKYAMPALLKTKAL